MKIHYKVKDVKDFDDLMKSCSEYFKNWDSTHVSFFLNKTDLIITYIKPYKGFGYSYILKDDEKLFKCKTAFLKAIKNL